MAYEAAPTILAVWGVCLVAVVIFYQICTTAKSKTEQVESEEEDVPIDTGITA